MATRTVDSTTVRRPALAALAVPGNALPAATLLFFLSVQVFGSSWPPSPSTVLLVTLNSIAMVLLVLRRDATRVGNKADLVIALAGVTFVSLLHSSGGDSWLSISIELAAFGGWVWALLSLGRSFGVVPADRGIVRTGPYRYVRHPIYAFEMIFYGGFLLASPTPRSFAVIAVWMLLQAARMYREERILGGYADYRQQVRWRILPGIW